MLCSVGPQEGDVSQCVMELNILYLRGMCAYSDGVILARKKIVNGKSQLTVLFRRGIAFCVDTIFVQYLR